MMGYHSDKFPTIITLTSVMIVMIVCERTGSDKRQNCRLSQQRTHEIIKI